MPRYSSTVRWEAAFCRHVNPNAEATVDERTPTEIVQSIQDQGRVITQSLARLNALISQPGMLRVIGE
jgi:hypothetical protein